MTTTKYDIGHLLYVINKEGIFEDAVCPSCDGFGYLFTPNTNNKVQCTSCYASGTKIGKYMSSEWRIKKGLTEVYQIHITDRGYIQYENPWDSYYAEEDVFLTKEEAQAECDKRNGIL